MSISVVVDILLGHFLDSYKSTDIAHPLLTWRVRFRAYEEIRFIGLDFLIGPLIRRRTVCVFISHIYWDWLLSWALLFRWGCGMTVALWMSLESLEWVRTIFCFKEPLLAPGFEYSWLFFEKAFVEYGGEFLFESFWC